MRRLRQVAFSEEALWDATALDETAFDAWAKKNVAKIDAAEARLRVALADADEATARQLVARVAGDRGFSIAWVG